MRTTARDGSAGMKQQIHDEVSRFVQESPLNRFPESDARYFDEPLLGYASATDPLFDDYKRIIGLFHQTPQAAMALRFGQGVKAATVISWILPVTLSTRESNRRETRYPSLAWSRTYDFGGQFTRALSQHVVAWLTEGGYHAVLPGLENTFRVIADTPAGIASNWSERHAAHAAGLGTFGLSDGLITPRGVAQYCGSVITDLELPASPRPYSGHHHDCLYFREKKCGACIARCRWSDFETGAR